MMFTKDQYMGEHEHTALHSTNAGTLIKTVTALYDKLTARGIHFRINPTTGSIISGNTFGGFRPQSCPIGAPQSKHKIGLAVDLYDPEDEIDGHLLANKDLLSEFGVYIEHPDKTPRWSHWQILPPASGKHIFMP
jgi:hypothetical protein